LPYNKRKVHDCVCVSACGTDFLRVCLCGLAFLQQEEIVEKTVQNVYCFDEASKGRKK